MLDAVFIAVVLITFRLFFISTKKVGGLLVYSIWTAFVGFLSYNGFFANTSTVPPRILLVIIPAIIFVVYQYRNIPVTEIRTSGLIAIHLVRIPVELCLYKLYVLGEVPVGMTFKGWNFDILIGLSAIIVAVFICSKPGFAKSKLFRLWNIAGMIMLGVIVITAILAAPSPVQLIGPEQPNTAILRFPFTLLPAVVVPLVLLSHLLCLKHQPI